MGQLKSDGKAIDVTAPAGTIVFGELYRIDGWNGIALSDIAVGDTDRKLALEVSSERIWYIKCPAALTGARGDLLSWDGAPGDGFKSGITQLETYATAGSFGPCAKVEEAVDANDYIGIRVLNGLQLTTA